MKQTKRPIRKARRKARRAKVKTAAQRLVNLEARVNVLEQVVDALAAEVKTQ